MGIPEREDWTDATEQARSAFDNDDPREMVKGLNCEIDRLTEQSYVLKDSSDGQERAVDMFLQEHESFDNSQDRFVRHSPMAYALKEVQRYVIA